MSKKMINGVFGAVVGDALGVPYEFSTRMEMSKYPAVKMIGYGTHGQPVGTWSDDSSMLLATLYSIKKNNRINLEDIMSNFADWRDKAKFTATDEVFDIGGTCSGAISNYEMNHDVKTCGETSIDSNGNGSLMRIIPVCLFALDKKLHPVESMKLAEMVSSLTHAHPISKMACGIYYNLVRQIVYGNSSSFETRLQAGISLSNIYYNYNFHEKELFDKYYGRLIKLNDFKNLPEKEIKSTGYVVDTLEAAIWCLLNTNSYKNAVLKAVNLGGDTDTIACVCGGLAGLFYGYDNIPSDWLDLLERREWIYELCK